MIQRLFIIVALLLGALPGLAGAATLSILILYLIDDPGILIC